MFTVGIEDPISEEAIQSFQEIDKNLNAWRSKKFQLLTVKIRMLSGDHIETAKSVAKKFGMITDKD